MRIVYLCNVYPFPPTDASSNRVWNVTRHLGARNEVLVLTTGRPESPHAPIAGVSIESLPAPPLNESLRARLWRAARAMAMGIPAPTLAHRSPELLERLSGLCARGWPDVVIAEENASGDLLRFVPRTIPRVWVKHSIHSLDAKEHRLKRAPRSLYLLLQQWVAWRYERSTLRTADLVATVAEEDREHLRAAFGEFDCIVVPNGVERDRFPRRPDPAISVVAFVGNFAWGANVHAVRWLIEGVWPIVVRARPEARLRLIGRKMSQELKQEASGVEGVEVVGAVESVADALTSAAISVVPVVTGTGLRTKLLESISCGVPVVTTSLGARGLPMRDEDNCLIADDPETFASSVIELLDDPEKRERLSDAGETVAAMYDWDRIIEAFEEQLISRLNLMPGPSAHRDHSRRNGGAFRRKPESQLTKGLRILFLLGRKDSPTDAIRDYSTLLAEALGQAGHRAVMSAVRWDQDGWWRALARLRRQLRSEEWDWVFMQHTHLMWSKRGLPLWALIVAGALKMHGKKLLLVMHDPMPFQGRRLRDAVRRICQVRVMRLLVSLADRTVLAVAPDRIPWARSLAAHSPRLALIPVGPNILPVPTVRTSAEPNLRVCVFGITGGKDEEVQQIAAVSRHVADRLGAISLSIVGRGSAEVEDRLNSLLTGSRTSLHVLGVAPSESVSRGLSESDALLFVRSEISSRRGTAVAGIAHGLPVVGYEGPETAWPVTEAGLALAPMNDVQALAENLIRLATYIDWAKELSDRSRTAYKLHFAWPRIAERFVEVISDQAGDGQQAIPTAGSAHS